MQRDFQNKNRQKLTDGENKKNGRKCELVKNDAGDTADGDA